MGSIAGMLSLLLSITMLCEPRCAQADEADGPLRSITPAAIRADLRFLSDALLEGRGTGSRGYEIAAHYVASRFEGMGLAPAGDGGSWFQSVPLRESVVEEQASSAALHSAGGEVPLRERVDVLLSGDPSRQETYVDAPVVFAGYGITAPSQHYDDYQGLDVKGKIVAVIFGAPDFPAAVKAHYSAGWLKREIAVAHGAVGYLLIYDPVLQHLYPFETQVRDLAIPKRNWMNLQGQPDHDYPALKAVGFLSLAGATKLFAASGHTPEQVYEAAKRKKPPGAFALKLNARVHTVTHWNDISAANVVARLDGSDPGLLAQTVVFSAHLDHLGVSTPVDGDAIYNGALDNASGVAVMLEVAQAFAGMTVKPRRSLVFVAVTAEESGLLGSDYFANYPTVPAKDIIADINMDEDTMLWPLRDVIALGAEHSTLEKVVSRAATRLDLVASPDPSPERVYFIRSDQYSFVKQGIPAFALSAGLKSEDPAVNPRKILETWEENIYHHPQDDMTQPGLDFDAGAQYARVAFLCGLYTANDPMAPAWNPGDFFGATFATGRAAR